MRAREVHGAEREVGKQLPVGSQQLEPVDINVGEFGIAGHKITQRGHGASLARHLDTEQRPRTPGTNAR